MKKSIAITIIMFMIIALLGGVVNAASTGVSISSTGSAKVNDEISVTINFDAKLGTAGFSVNYDASKVKFIDDSQSADVNGTLAAYNSKGTVKVAFLTNGKSMVSKITLKFEVLKQGDVNFKLAVQELTDEKENDLTANIKKGTAVTKVQESTSTPGGNNTSGGNTTKPNTNTTKPNTNTTKPNTNTNKNNTTNTNITNNTVNQTENEVYNEVINNEIDSNEIDNNQIGNENQITSTDTTQEENGSVLNYVMYTIIAVLAIAIIIAVVIVIRKRNQKTK